MDNRGDIVVEARGHRCPIPTLRLRRAVEDAAPGAVLILISDDPMARVDAAHYAREAGLDLVSVEEMKGALIVKVRKP
jgi:tRNA 2-thiouridine synthesizing protein A